MYENDSWAIYVGLKRISFYIFYRTFTDFTSLYCVCCFKTFLDGNFQERILKVTMVSNFITFMAYFSTQSIKQFALLWQEGGWLFINAVTRWNVFLEIPLQSEGRGEQVSVKIKTREKYVFYFINNLPRNITTTCEI